MKFEKYQHVERFGNTEVEDITNGACYIFPKLDGTNASVWTNEQGEIKAGSRNRVLHIDYDNAGFCKFVQSDMNLRTFFDDYPELRLYGEWLVPHTIKTYEDNAWRKFYIFDVQDISSGDMWHYDEYQSLLDNYGLDFIPYLAAIVSPTEAELSKIRDEDNTYLIQEGKGVGEGIVVKNYYFVNRFGNTIWAKLVRDEFKQIVKVKGESKDCIETAIVEKYITIHLVDKTLAKIQTENDGLWTSKFIPQLLGRVYYDLIKEDAWEFLKKFKNPTINFKNLSNKCSRQVKYLKPELF